jgi:ABC-2 type transport system ATP-binding protein
MTNTVEVNHVVKSFADKVAVDDLSFSVAQGEIFGLIGPNGAGKTTTIKMMMDIIKPDSGEVTILGEKLSETTKNKLGYMPEERGLYRKQRVLDTIVYLASLKGMDTRAAAEKANQLLNVTGMLPHARKKIDELSKGMGQIIQFIVTIIHDPQLVILDEPFAGLDPVNTESIKNRLIDLRNEGKAVILSTHQMNQIEELCDRILMINNGRAVLYGDLTEIKSRYKNNAVLLDFEGELGEVPGVTEKRTHKGYVELLLDTKTTPQQLLERLAGRGLVINRFEIATPPLNEIFLKVVGKSNE